MARQQAPERPPAAAQGPAPQIERVDLALGVEADALQVVEQAPFLAPQAPRRRPHQERQRVPPRADLGFVEMKRAAEAASQFLHLRPGAGG